MEVQWVATQKHLYQIQFTTAHLALRDTSELFLVFLDHSQAIKEQ
jgi:hypothetical protein